MTKQPEGEIAGVKQLSGYMFSTTSPKLVRVSANTKKNLCIRSSTEFFQV